MATPDVTSRDVVAARTEADVTTGLHGSSLQAISSEDLCRKEEVKRTRKAAKKSR